jgi:hypothetical protein
MKKIILVSLFYSWLFSISCLAQEGVFNSRTGETLSQEAIKIILPDSFDLFTREEPLQVTLESNFKQLRKQKYKDEYQEALMHYQINDSILVKNKIRIKARGGWRKKICQFPPLKLNFKKSKLYVEDIENLEKVKMVTKCKSSRTYESYLLKEYLIYKIYNLFTDKSFKARLLKVRYVDTGRKNRKWETYAFLIEENDKMALRNNAGLAKQTNLSQQSLHPTHMNMVAIFQYMIGNADWAVPGQHNMKILSVVDINEPEPYPVPYDFDYTGLVDAEYAIPPEALGIENVRQRIFLGYCKSEEEYQATVDVFLEKEQEIYDLISNFEYLKKNEKKKMILYLKKFYQEVNKKGALERLFSDTCKK